MKCTSCYTTVTIICMITINSVIFLILVHTKFSCVCTIIIWMQSKCLIQFPKCPQLITTLSMSTLWSHRKLLARLFKQLFLFLSVIIAIVMNITIFLINIQNDFLLFIIFSSSLLFIINVSFSLPNSDMTVVAAVPPSLSVLLSPTWQCSNIPLSLSSPTAIIVAANSSPLFLSDSNKGGSSSSSNIPLSLHQ